MDKQTRRRSDYPFFISYRTRWSDNDQYAHVNNAVYYHLIDAVVNAYLIEHCEMDPATSTHIGLVVSSFCEFFVPVSFPDVLDLGVRVNKLGTSSVTYEVGIFSTADTPVAIGGYTHVFVDRTSRRSTPMNETLRSGLRRLMTNTKEIAVSKL